MAKKKRRSRGKSKGSQFERDICVRLSKWWTNDERTDIFWRSTTSGARAKARSKKGEKTFGQYGDVQATDPIGQPLMDLCTIEIKNGYNAVSIMDPLDMMERSKTRVWEDWVKQANTDAANAGIKSWMLIWKRDRRDAIVFMNSSYLYIELIAQGADLGKIRPKIVLFSGDSGQLPGDSGRIYGFRFSDFLSTVSPDHVKKALE